jgi:FlaA1/EpsC-like NDP-sugar epimerase
MLRRFSINFALFSMLLDGLSVGFCLWFAGYIRPVMNEFSFIKPLSGSDVVPTVLYVLFPLVWVVIFASLSVYDGRKFLRAADELAALFLSTFIASISAAGILYFSYREVSRALFVVFVMSTFLLCLLWRALARIYFRTRPQAATVVRHLAVVGTGP